MRMVISVGSVVAKNGFEAADLETPDGTKLGRWARGRTPIIVP